jgi:cyclophilin family peptidyl-prolyl cis-trans isomerase
MHWKARPSLRLALSQARALWQDGPMKKLLLTAAALLVAMPSLAEDKPVPSPGEIVAAAPKGEWVAIPASDLLVMDLAPDAKGKPRRVVIQLMPPPFSARWRANVELLVLSHWWDGTSINRVQDNYVVQWGDPNADDRKAAKALPTGMLSESENGYAIRVPFGVSRNECPVAGVAGPPKCVKSRFAAFRRRPGDQYAPITGFYRGWPFGADSSPLPPQKACLTNQDIPSGPVSEGLTAWPVHCYSMVGVGRDLSPNTGSGAELYTVIGHAPRHLDRNIALVGRVIEGIEYLSSLPRGHGPLGFYDLEQGDERVPIVSIHPGPEAKDLPAYEYLSTESQSFARYADARANRRDAFFIRPAGGADICNIPVPVRRVAAK